MDYKKLVVQHKKKFFYTIGILFLINLSLIVFDRGILIKEECFMKTNTNPVGWDDLDCSEARKTKINIPWSHRTECTYWFGRGTFWTVMHRFDYCKFTEELQ